MILRRTSIIIIEVLCRIIGRAVMWTFENQIIASAGLLQLGAGQRSGCEALFHAFRLIYEEQFYL